MWSLGHSLLPAPPARPPPPRRPGLTRGLRKLCVSSKRCRLSTAVCTSDGRFFCRPWGARAEPQQAGRAPCTHRAQLPRPRSAPQRYLKQSSEQGLVSVEVGRVRSVEAWGGRNGSALSSGAGHPLQLCQYICPPHPAPRRVSGSRAERRGTDLAWCPGSSALRAFSV